MRIGAGIVVKTLRQPCVIEMAGHVLDGERNEMMCKKDAVIDNSLISYPECSLRNGSKRPFVATKYRITYD